MSNDARIAELIFECQRQSESCNYTTVNFTIWLRFLRGARFVCQVSPIIFGALATWKVAAQSSPAFGAVCALLATVIPPAYRASKLDTAIKDYAALAGEYANLRDRFRQMALIASHQEFAAFDAQAKTYFDRLEKARRLTYTPPEWSFWLAQRKIQKGHYKHDYDNAGGGKQ